MIQVFKNKVKNFKEVIFELLAFSSSQLKKKFQNNNMNFANLSCSRFYKSAEKLKKSFFFKMFLGCVEKL